MHAFLADLDYPVRILVIIALIIGVHMNIISCAKRRFIVYSVKNIDEGVEILTGKEAGDFQPDGIYPEETINFLVDRKLKNLAEGIKNT